MKVNYILLSISMLMCNITMKLQAQIKPSGNTGVTASPVNNPAAYNKPVVNFIRTWQPSMPSTDTAVIVSTLRTTTEVKQKAAFFDGLGRPLQSVNKGISPMGRDLVIPVVYDTTGRERYKYLPYVGNTGDGRLKTDPFNQQEQFYKDASLNPGAIGEKIFYAQMEYEQSPLNRLSKSYTPGNSWALEGGNHPSENQYLLNTTADSVHIWKMTSQIPVNAGTYNANQLSKNILIDESGNRVVEFKNKQGRVVFEEGTIR